MYPLIRFRRNRKALWLRELIAESNLSISDLVLPLFVVEGHNEMQEIKTMPGIYRLSIDQIVETAKKAADFGINAIALFPSIDHSLKSDNADEAYNLDNLICRTIIKIKNANIDIGIICDVALDPYTISGHDGIVHHGEVDNDRSVKALCNQALVLAKAGVDIVAPSDMMDGRIAAIREYLDKEGFINVGILAYAAKYASSFYGPFRDAVQSNKKNYLDKSSYQIDVRNIKEAMLEIEHDIAEGADIVMVKPGMPFLDVIREAANNFNAKIFAYQVSGEYAMLKFAAETGAIDWERALIESLISFKRAGATGIFTYAALEVAEILKHNNIK
ncbi:porphobilinogen synthase [Rickettsia prowazekii]|uniref:Delta-aminolevulinic acid dehydratase n=2 Tax=Rickettsia prowazekii TaxID=782 RepID=Q9ZD11_RICPR|nr:porphobilinogen synthase [Rickettsia prowazekii]ADE30069.1 Delta-aminolevulinic aciddehydratase [Rickettsia prowazekii str. Rp22]AFE49343.1 delta-aminolevulinic acid dehydratase [Rickettsia prowazekii str. Chernikova]AFE50187.1 delta-aminolevulinic acid dehydratase [Rickettsia prowazekii str. Katsinyian]AFE51033.1 delta-aminolevulinic acid dehydratase [Rickettsia prowazekii str. BuV67-CWPP]AFE51869.1 delta-aminolevulinic acid dehydratase [Rickettsia prowazekii str. Dachau]